MNVFILPVHFGTQGLSVELSRWTNALMHGMGNKGAESDKDDVKLIP
jgi:hypothetical protein